MLTQEGIVKIADFGFGKSRRDPAPFTNYISTRWYRAPEIILKFSRYDVEIDVFALGCIFAELYRLAPLFDGANEIDHLYRIINILGTPPNLWIEGYKNAYNIGIAFPRTPKQSLPALFPNASASSIDLLDRMLNYIPENRITADEILAHPFCLSQDLTNTIRSAPPLRGPSRTLTMMSPKPVLPTKQQSWLKSV